MSTLRFFSQHLFFAVVLAVNSLPALAQYEPGTTSAFFRGTAPSNLIAGQPFVLQVASGPCEFLSDERDGATVHSIVGNDVTIFILGVPDNACSATPGEREYDLPGLPAAGFYRFHVHFLPFEPDVPGEFIGARDVLVVASIGMAGATSVPMFGYWGMLAMMLGLGGFAGWRLMRQSV